MHIHVFKGLSALSKSSARRADHSMTLIDELRSHSLEAGGATIPQGEMVARCWGTSQGKKLILHAPGFGSAMDALRLTDNKLYSHKIFDPKYLIDRAGPRLHKF
ncbi:hypothetical protein DL93DRAFT_2103534 [Clavulina sp. PMI_390]|nr:hypothetical protein DL93DRAFT_2103534 [Clavulina sp. PMI_390]